MRLQAGAILALVLGVGLSCSGDAGGPTQGTAAPIERLAEGAPPLELDSYSTTVAFELDLGDVVLGIDVAGLRSGGRFVCTITYDTGEAVRTEIVTGDETRVWLGVDEPVRSRYAEPSVISALSLCPATTDFWLDYRIGELDEVAALGTETVNGVTAAEYRLADEIASIAGSRVVPELQGASFETLNLWRELDSGSVVRLVIGLEGDARTMASTLGMDEGTPRANGRLGITIDILDLDSAPGVTLPE